MKKTNIYGLFSTRDEKIRYIGKSNNPKSRLKDHLWGSKNTNTYKSCWIKKELSDGYDIKYEILEVCDVNEWVDREIYYISTYPNLTNHHKGGLGGSPIKYDKTYEELKKWVNENLPKEVNSIKKWKSYITENHKNKIPLTPNKVYHNNGWISWSEFLNTNNVKNIKYISYEEFKQWIKDNNIKNYSEFRKLKKPIGVPGHPNTVYKDEWIGWVDVIRSSVNRNRSIYWSYSESKKYLNEKYPNITANTFLKLCANNELPIYIPKKPSRIYENFSFIKFLRLVDIEYLDFNSAKKIIHNFKIKNSKMWRIFKKSEEFPNNIPKTPEKFYKDQWVNWYDWLGNTK